MHVLILTYGSRGDVQPYVALGKELQAEGHDVTLATSERFSDFITEHGLRFAGLSDDLLAIIDTDQGREMLENTSNLFQVVKRTIIMLKQVGPMQRSLLDDSWAAAEAAQPDLIVFHPKSYGGPHIAEKLGIPAILALPIPMLVPTAEHPIIGLPDLKFGGWYNRMTYRLVNALFGLSAGKHVRAWRAAHDLPRQKRFDILHTTDGRDIPALHAISKYVVPEPFDWPDTAVMTGFWFLDRPDGWTPPAELEAFLNSGPPPVYVGFGSMAGRDPERLASIVIEALQSAGVRGIIATGWGGLKTESLPDTILKIDQAPHEWLFPRTTAIVHHGGAGTTAAALRAGKPSVVVPFFGDQPFWGQRINKIGAAPKPIPQKKLSPDNLARAIVSATSDVGLRRTAAELGEKIRSEHGTVNAVAFIEKHAGIS
jgi:sterol 3beta-glucosyltransferase